MNCFIYDWREDDEIVEQDDDSHADLENRFVIRGYGINDQNEDVVVTVTEFVPYMYIELPSIIQWKNQLMLKTLKDKMEEGLTRIRCGLPTKCALLYKKKLYYYNSPENALCPFLLMAFSSKADRINAARYLIKNDNYTVYGKRVKIKCHEHEASPLLQFLSFRDIPSNGWITVNAPPIKCSHTFHCKYDLVCSYKQVSKRDMKEETIPHMRILSIDIEVYSGCMNRMPCAENEQDVVFQIACIYHHGDVKRNYLLTIGEVVDMDNEFIQMFKNEKDLLMGYTKLVNKLNPHIIIGYNIFGFDLPYLMDRAKFHNMLWKWSMQSKRKNVAAKEKIVSWSSSAYQNQEFRYLDVEGRILIDLLPIIRRDYKLRNYKLSTVANHFMGSSKDPVTPKDIFTFFARSQQKNDLLGKKLLSCVGKYCIQDAVLVIDLFYKLQTWIGLLEMAKLCNTSIQALYTQGQQIKVFSQIYKICMYKQIVVESSLYNQNMVSQYAGAFVFDPTPGIYDDVLPFDFSSLYPTSIIAYNIDYSTLVGDNSIPDEDCHVIEWKEPEHNKSYRFRFIKEPKGILPSLLEDLLDQRKKTKGQMKSLDKNSLLYAVLDKRQLAYKVSANSMYGAMGVTRGYLPFLPGAMCTTAKGRQSIQKAAEFVQQYYKGKLIYGDTDSIYCHFPNVPTEQLWSFAMEVEKKFLELFPPPMKLVFEEKVYSRFLIFTKKRYLALTQNQDLSIDKDLTIRGVLLARRDNCLWVRYIYENVVRKIMSTEKCTWLELQYYLIEEFNKLCSHYWDSSYVVITKAVGKDYKMKPCPGFENGQITDQKKWSKRLTDLGIHHKSKSWMTEYKEKILPAHVQLANKMKRRGVPVEVGSRIEYLMIQHEDLKAKTFKKIEDPIYQKSYSDILLIDFLYVLHLAMNPLDQLLHVAFGQEKFVSKQYEMRIHKHKMLMELMSIFTPIVLYE